MRPISTKNQFRSLCTNGVIKCNGISIRIYDDNSILRNDVRLDLAKSMTLKEAVRALGLG